MYQYKAEVLRILDGDTIDVRVDLGFKTFRKERIRFYGIDTPESRGRKKCKKGIEVKEMVKNLLTSFPNITLETTKQGKFGRYLGIVYLNLASQELLESYGTIIRGLVSDSGIDLNNFLVLNGYAKKYFGGKR